MSSKIHLYQIAYSEETLAGIEEGFEVLNNLKNERPDWFEYWPIRNFLMRQNMEEDSFYGFFSPRFRIKVGLSAAQVRQFVDNHSASNDVIIFSPQPDMGAFFLNVFEQAEVFDKDMIATYAAVLRKAKRSILPDKIVMDSRQIVFSNYFVARPAFWREWMTLNEVIFRLSEDVSDPIGVELRKPTSYTGAVQRKVFLQERTASYLLSINDRWRSVRYNAFETAWSASALNEFPDDAVISDALKIAYRETNDNQYISIYAKIRQKLHDARPSKDQTNQKTSNTKSSDIWDTVAAAEAMIAQGRLEEARKIYEDYLTNTVTTSANDLTYIAEHNLAVIYRSLDLLVKAEELLRSATKKNPKLVQGYLNHGLILEQLGQERAAIDTWKKALDHLKDGDRKKYSIIFNNNIGRLSENLGDFPQAEAALTASLDEDARQPAVLHHWIHLRQKQCKWPVFSERIKPDNLVEYASPLSILSLSDEPEAQLSCAKRLVSEKIKSFSRMTPTNHRYDHQKIRIGYLSSDLSMHAVSLLTVELFELHNRELFEVYAFCWSPEDGTAFRKRVVTAFDHFYSIKDIDDAAAAELIKNCEIDILVDLQGLSARARPEIIARGPAPIQLTWLGYPGTSAIPNNDYVIADDYVLPVELEPYFTEKPLRLPSVFQVSDTTRHFGAERSRSFYGLPDNRFIFCAFNNNYKITNEMFEVWIQILEENPESVLWLLEDNMWSRENLILYARSKGILENRLFFAGRIEPRDYLQRFRAADLFLDTFPYNAGTTANDALWAGLPLLTCSGRTYVSRMAGSLLREAGLPQLITQSLTDYKKMAQYYAQNISEIDKIKNHLKLKKSQGELFNTLKFVKEFESALCDLLKS